jgi:hypothetical protein
MWFVILKTLLSDDLLSDDPSAGSAQPEMLLVADDANTAYSNPRSLPKCAQTLLPLSLNPTARHSVRAPFLPRLKKHIHPCRNWYGRYPQ